MQILYSFLSIGWGFISDIDIESERLRSLGYQRFTIWTLHRLVRLRSYKGKVSYILQNNNASSGGDTIDETSSHRRRQLNQDKQTKLKHSRSCNTYLNRDAAEYSDDTTTNDASLDDGGNLSDLEFNDVISLETSINQSSFRSRCNSWLSVGSRRSTYYSISDSIYHSKFEKKNFCYFTNWTVRVNAIFIAWPIVVVQNVYIFKIF